MTGKELQDLSHTHPIVAYDGVCIMCSSFIQRLLKLDRKGILRYASLQSESMRMILDNLPDQDSIVLIEAGKIYTKSTAVLRISRHLHAPHSWLYFSRVIPRMVRDAVYDIIAYMRYRILGKKETCEIPDIRYRERFLDV